MTGLASRHSLHPGQSHLDRCGPVLSVVEGSKTRPVPRCADALDTPSTPHVTLRLRTNEYARHIRHTYGCFPLSPHLEERHRTGILEKKTAPAFSHPHWRSDGIALESLKRRQPLLSLIRHYDVPDIPETLAHSLLRIAMNYARLAANTLPKEPKSVQKVQEQCRKDFQKCTASQSWTVSRSALDSAESAESAGFLKNFLLPRKLGNYIPYCDSARRRLAGNGLPSP